jgi:hypothetical protein
MMTQTTARRVYDDIRNTLDFLASADLIYYQNSISLTAQRISWHARDPSAPFLMTREHPTIDQYLAWLGAGAYSAILFDGSLVQLTYEIAAARIVSHRLAYVPCPYDLDPALVREGGPLAEIVELYRSSDAVLRSPIRFDFDIGSESRGHPAAHLTLNSVGCRIACVAPLHVLRFVDFVFRNFYPSLWSAHQAFFAEARSRHVGPPVISNDDREDVHLSWPTSAAPVGTMDPNRSIRALARL